MSLFSQLQKHHINTYCAMCRPSEYVTAKPAMAMEKEKKRVFQVHSLVDNRKGNREQVQDKNCQPGLIFSGKETKRNRQKANVIELNISIRKQSHCIAAEL